MSDDSVVKAGVGGYGEGDRREINMATELVNRSPLMEYQFSALLENA
jgi:hypothetical protein